MVDLGVQIILSDYKNFVFSLHYTTLLGNCFQVLLLHIPFHWCISQIRLGQVVETNNTWNLTGLTCHIVQCGSWSSPKKLFSNQWVKDPYSFHLVTTPSGIPGSQDICGTKSKNRASHWWCLGHISALVTRGQRKGAYEPFSFLGRQSSTSQHNGGFFPNTKGNWKMNNQKY